jgi:hypothetical protein
MVLDLTMMQESMAQAGLPPTTIIHRGILNNALKWVSPVPMTVAGFSTSLSIGVEIILPTNTTAISRGAFRIGRVMLGWARVTVITTDIVNLKDCTKLHSIGESAFEHNNISTLEFPSVDEHLPLVVGKNSFTHSKRLTSINWGRVTALGDAAFNHCTALRYLNFDGSLLQTDDAFDTDGPFKCCSNLQYVRGKAIPNFLGPNPDLLVVVPNQECAGRLKQDEWPHTVVLASDVDEYLEKTLRMWYMWGRPNESRLISTVNQPKVHPSASELEPHEKELLHTCVQQNIGAFFFNDFNVPRKNALTH